jgi:predicted nucleic acid-binding protein
MTTYALDTNIVSYILRGRVDIMHRISDYRVAGDRVVIPPIVYFEVKRGLTVNDATVKLSAFERLCERWGVENMDIATLDTATKIYADARRSGHPIEDADILIAATCVSRGYTLVTNNIKHFEGITGLNLTNWA